MTASDRCFGGKEHAFGPVVWSPLYKAYVKVCDRCSRIAGQRGPR